MVSKARPPVSFIRHGETDWNRQGLIQGWTDTPLNDTGHRQARAVAQALLDVPGLSPDWNFVVSPLRRVRQTMAHVVDPSTGEVWSASISGLPAAVFEQLQMAWYAPTGLSR